MKKVEIEKSELERLRKRDKQLSKIEDEIVKIQADKTQDITDIGAMLLDELQMWM